MIAVEGLKFTIPLFVLNAMDSAHGQYASFYGRLFDFLSGDDLVAKLKVIHFQEDSRYDKWCHVRSGWLYGSVQITNRFFANQFLSQRPPSIEALETNRAQRQMITTAKQMIALTDHDVWTDPTTTNWIVC
jgi:hypothetical protein